MSLEIKGFLPVSMIDYPGKICSVIFLGQCNFRCPYCQNPDLVLKWDSLLTIPEEKIIDSISKRKDWVDGVCFTGGEPTMHKELPNFISKIKKLDFLVKVDTNGTNPDMLKLLIRDKLIDYIAMDIKAPLNKYEKVVKVRVDLKKIQDSIDIILKSGVEYEFRTTAVPELVEKKDVEEIGRWLKGSKRYFIHQFVPDNALDESYRKKIPFKIGELEEFVDIAKPFFEVCEKRGL